jgi:hypothetical protein
MSVANWQEGWKVSRVKPEFVLEWFYPSGSLSLVYQAVIYGVAGQLSVTLHLHFLKDTRAIGADSLDAQ